MGLSMFQKRLQNSTMSIDLQEQKSKGVFSCSQIHFMEPDGIEDHAFAFLYRVNGTITVIAVGTSKRSVGKNRPDLLWLFQVADLEYGPTAKYFFMTITLGTCKPPMVPYNPAFLLFRRLLFAMPLCMSIACDAWMWSNLELLILYPMHQNWKRTILYLMRHLSSVSGAFGPSGNASQVCCSQFHHV